MWSLLSIPMEATVRSNDNFCQPRIEKFCVDTEGATISQSCHAFSPPPRFVSVTTLSLSLSPTEVVKMLEMMHRPHAVVEDDMQSVAMEGTV